MKAKWNGALIAQSEDTVVLEGNHYFPMHSVNPEYIQKSSAMTTCAWKGRANYYDLVVDGKTNAQAAWYYADPKPEADQIRDRVAFWKGVEITL